MKTRTAKARITFVAMIIVAMIFVFAGNIEPTYALDNSGIYQKPTLKELRDRYNSIGTRPMGLSTFKKVVDVEAYTPGDYTDEAKAYAQNYINFMRYQAGLGGITLDATLNENAAQGALIMARNKVFGHDQQVPDGISAAEAKPGRYSTKTSNISSSSASGSNLNIVETALLGQMKDDRNSNITSVGHRRWLLTPSTSTMGIGSAYTGVAEGGWYKSYTAVRVFNNTYNEFYDQSYGLIQHNNSTDYDFVSWPASGYMLNTVFEYNTPWSISLNEDRYSAIPDNVIVTIKRKSDNKTWTLNKECTLSQNGNGYLNDNYLGISNNSSLSITGEGHCLIFAPNPNDLGTGKLKDEFEVTVSNLKTKSGASTSIQYNVIFKDLEPNMDEMNILLNDSTKEYTGSALTTTVRVMYDSQQLIEGTDYTLSYVNNTNVGTAIVTITGKGKYKGSVTKTFEITPKKITVPTANSGLKYTGLSQVGVASTADYIVTNGEKTDAGNYSATVTLNDKVNTAWTNGETGDKSVVWAIAKATLADSNLSITLPANGFVYDGTDKEPNVSVMLGDVEIDKSNYDVSYSNNRNAADATSTNPPTVTVTGKKNCEGEGSVTFTIKKKELYESMVSGIRNYEYTGSEIVQGSLAVKDGETTLRDEDYAASYSNNVNVGIATITIKGKGNYTGTFNKSFSISAKPITGAEVTLEADEYEYTGSGKEPAVTVTLDGKTLVKDEGYSVDYRDNTDAGTAKVVISGKGNYSGEITKLFSIKAKPVEALTIDPITGVTYSGSEAEPSLVVKDGSTELAKGTDYDVTYEDNINAGTAKAIITGKGNYKDSKEGKFTISPKNIGDEDVTVADIPEQSLEDSAVEPAMNVSYNGKDLTSANDFDVTYENNDSEGEGKAIIGGKGNYTGVVTKTFTIVYKERADLKELIDSLKADYSNATDSDYKAALNAAIEKAEAVANDQEATRKQLDNAKTTAETERDEAVKALKEKQENGDTDEENQKGEGGSAIGKGASAKAADIAITTSSSEEGPAGSKYNLLQLKSTKQANTSVTLAWKKVSGAKKYVIYGNVCGKKNKLKNLGNVAGSSTSKAFTKVAGKKVKKGTYYKFMVVALDKNDHVITTSKVVHVATKGGKVGNHKSVSITAKVDAKGKAIKKYKALSSTIIKKGKAVTIKAKATPQSKKLKVGAHRKIVFESSNTKIATVNAKGKITAKAKGSCYIYAYAQNGVMKRVKVTVK